MRIKEMAELLGIKPETIRYYEKEGIVVPKRTGSGEYRNYDTWDFFYLAECIHFRRLGFTIKEIPSAGNKVSIEQLREHFQQMESDTMAEIDHKTLLLQYYRYVQMSLENLEENIGNFWVIQRPAYRYIIFTTSDDDVYGKIDSSKGLLPQWLHAAPFAQSAQVINLDSESPSARQEWTILFESTYLRTLNLPVNECVKEIEASLCVKTIIDMGNKGEFSADILTELLTQLKEKGYTPYGKMMVSLLTRCWDDEGFHRYCEVTIPVRKKKKSTQA